MCKKVPARSHSEPPILQTQSPKMVYVNSIWGTEKIGKWAQENSNFLVILSKPGTDQKYKSFGTRIQIQQWDNQLETVGLPKLIQTQSSQQVAKFDIQIINILLWSFH